MSEQLFVSTRKGLFRLRDSKITDAWFIGDPVPMMTRDPGDGDPGALYAAVKHEQFGQKLHRSDDDGKTWSEITPPTYPQLPQGREPDRCPMRGIEIPWKLDMIWELETDGQGTLWCGTLPGGLFKSTDRGETWQLIESLWNQPARAKWMGGGYDFPGIHSICIHPRDPKHITAGVSCGGVWVTEDGGASWACRATGMRAAYAPPEFADDPDIQDAHRVVQCRDNPDALWAQHHCGIFRTTDGGRQWIEIEKAGPSTFGFAVVVHPNDGDTAWFVPGVKDEQRVPVDGKFVVTRTRDGGQSFDVLTEGLPQQDAYDIVYRHAMDIDASGNKLAMGSTTGSLWTSDNQGDSWQCITNHLPPVYAVRFVS